MARRVPEPILYLLWAGIVYAGVTVLVIILGGCGAAPSTTPDAPPGSVQIVLGGAMPDGSGFLPLAGDVTLIPGAQGGFHVWLKYRVAGMAGSAKVRHTARRASDGRLVLTAERMQSFDLPDAGGDWWELPTAIPAFMCPTPIGVQVRDELIVYRVEIENGDGTPLASGEAEATPRCPTDDQVQAALCVSICSG